MNYKRNIEAKKIKKKTIPAIIFLIVILLAGSILFQYLDKKKGNHEQQAEEESTEDKDIVEWNGNLYKKIQNIETYLLVGTDISGKYADYLGYHDGIGQADYIRLLVIDKTKNTYATLSINRNTLADFAVYDQTSGDYIGDSFGQICLAYAFGYDGKEKSCENMAEAVSKLLNGQKIDAFVSLGLDSISVINHMLGGVTVTIEDDFSETCPSLVKGKTITLTDEEAKHYCHDRFYVSDETNENRMKRQENYLTAAKPLLLEKCRNEESFVLDLYDALSDYMYTSLTKNQMSKIAKAILQNEDIGDYSIDGEISYNEETQYMELTPDEDQLEEIIITLFYKRVYD